MNQSTPVAMTKSVKIYARDKIDLSVWSYYEGIGFGTSNVTSATMIAAIASVTKGLTVAEFKRVTIG
jgi:hypothetical protein